MLLFRCIDTSAVELQRALPAGMAFALRAERALPPISYRLFSAPLPPSPETVVSLAAALPGCDLSAWVE